jgi:hypothetical protein
MGDINGQAGESRRGQQVERPGEKGDGVKQRNAKEASRCSRRPR